MRCARRRSSPRATTDARQSIGHDRISSRESVNDRADPRAAPLIACCRGVVDRTERKRMIEARARRARVRASRRRAPGGEYRSGYTLSRSAPGASPRAPVVVAERRLRRLRATTGKDRADAGDRSDLRAVLTCCRGAATPSWSWCWRPCRWRPRGPC